LSFDGRPASRVAQESSGSWGAFLLVTCSLCKQRKVTRQKGEKQPTKQPQTRGHPCPPYNDQSKEQPFISITTPSPSTHDKKASTQTGAGF
jgi:hypothetical protein